MPGIEVPSQACGAGSAVRLPGEKLGGTPSFVSCQIDPDELAYCFDVFLEVVVVLGFLTGDGPGEAGADRIDEHKVGDVEDRLVVVDELPRRWIRHPVVVQEHAPRPKQTEVKPYRR